MTVKEYYLEHFSELSESKKFHLATRLKNWFGDSYFADYIQDNEPSRDLAAILANNDYSKVNFYELRKPFFEKYNNLYAIEAMLFRVFHLLIEYDVDLRDDFLQLVDKKEFEKLCETLRNDDEAFFALTTFAVNVLSLAEELFPSGNDIYVEMLKKALASRQDVTSIYLYTHIILCESRFYHDKRLGHHELYVEALQNCDKIIADNFDKITLDMKFEFLVCAQIIGYEAETKEKIRTEADLNKTNFIIDPRKPARLNTFDGAEHRNVLYMMSGLDI